MKLENLKNITNNFQDARLVSLASWPRASEISPRDRGGPYVITQEGIDPEDMTAAPDEFILGRSGMWLSLSHFFRLPVPERRAQFVFGTAAEAMKVMNDLTSKVSVLRPDTVIEAEPEADEMAAAIQAGKAQKPGATGQNKT